MKYLYIGNRFYILKAMLEVAIDPVLILAANGSYLEKELLKANLNFTAFHNKVELIDIIKATEFDLLISSGCPYILPVSNISKDHQIFINIHPSYLPDLRGPNPINGAMIYGDYAGATCHIMDDGIDTGPIISRVKIPVTEDTDLGLLYQLSFLAEKEAFLNAIERNFKPDETLTKTKANHAYYKKSENDSFFSIQEDIHKIQRRIKAFGIASQGAHFIFDKAIFKVFDAQIIKNPYLVSKIDDYQEHEIVFIYDDNIVVKKQQAFLKLKGVKGDISKLHVGQLLV